MSFGFMLAGAGVALPEHVREHVRLCTLYRIRSVATRRGPAVLVERILRLLRGPASKGSYRARNQKPETAVTVGTSVTRRRASRIFVFRDIRDRHEITIVHIYTTYAVARESSLFIFFL